MIANVTEYKKENNEMKKKMLVLTLIGSLALTGCTKTAENEQAETPSDKAEKELNQVDAEDSEEKDAENKSEEKAEKKAYITTINYSNMVNEKTKEEIKSRMLECGISEENAEHFITVVSEYNERYKEIGLTQDGFIMSDYLEPAYDLEKLSELSDEGFDGYNCRMTSFLLMKDLIDIDTKDAKEHSFIQTDMLAIEEIQDADFTEENIAKFQKLYGSIDTELVKDINIHLDKVKKYWADNNLSFKDSAAKMITVWFHDDLDNKLFAGHVGIMLPSKEDDSVLFIEKISISDPYQAIKFKDKQEMNDYLMAKYDVSYGQPTAKPFIMENDELIDVYRENPLNVEMEKQIENQE